MAQARRVDLTTISTQNGTSKNKENKHITLRFEVKLENNDGKSECEFSWLDLVQKNQNGDKIDDLDNDDAHLNAIAKRFEEKYGEKPSAKKKRRIMDDFVDLGNGYDLEDSFIDNDEAYDEVVPHNLKTKWSGFYINNGQLDFRVDSDDEDIIMTKGKRKGGVSSSSSEEESDERQKMRKKVSKNDLYLKKRRQAVDNLIKVKKKKSMGLSLKRKLSEGKTTNDIEEVTDDNDNVSDDGNDKNGSQITNEEKEEGTPKWKKDQNPTSAPELPSFISSDLRSSIDKLKRLAVESKAGKCLFFSNEEVTSLLLKIWMFCKVTSAGTRRIVFEHLAAFLPCNKDTLMKRAKNLANNATEKKDKCADLIEKLKSEVAKTMPEQEKKFLEEKEAWAAKNKIEGNGQEGTASNAAGGNNENKVTMTVRRKFRWTKELRSILNDLIESKMKEWENMETKFLPADEFLKKFLENDVKKLWPKGWIQVRTLFNDTRMVHKDLTGGDWIPKNQRKTSEATNNSISSSNNTSISIQSPNVDSTNMKGSKLLNFATDSLLAVARSKENKRKLESEEKAKNSELAKPASISISNTTETKTSPSKQTPTTNSEMCKVYLKGSSISESSFYESFKKSFLTAGLPINKATDLSAQITKNLVNNYMSKSKQTSPSGKSSTATATSTQPNSSSQIHSGYSNMISSLAKVVKSNELSKTTTSNKSSNEVKGYALPEVIDLSTGATSKPKSANSLDEAIESLKAFNSFSSSQEMINKPIQVVELQQKSSVSSPEQRKVEEAKIRKGRKLDTKLAQLQQQRQKQQAIRMEKQFNKPKQEQNAFPASIDCFLVDNSKTSPEKTTNILIPKKISPSKKDIYLLKPEKRLGNDETKVREADDQKFRFEMERKEEMKRQEELKRKSVEMIKKQQEDLLKKRREEELLRRKQDEELIRKQKGELIRKQQEDQYRRQELIRKQQEEQQLRKQQEEQIRKQHEEQLRKQQEEQLRKQQEEQLRQQEELRRKQQQEEMRRKQQEELRRKQQQEELRRKQQEELRRKQQQEELRRKQQQEELRRKQQEELRRKQEEKKKQEEALIKKQREEMLKLQEQKQRSQVYSTWSHSIGASVITTAQATSTHSKPNVVWSQNQNLTGSYPSLTISDFSLPDLSASDALIPQMEIQSQQQQQQQQQQPTSIAFQPFSPRLTEANPRLRHQRPF